MRPIPTSLLPSTMRWRAPSDPDLGMGGEYGDRRTVRHVRFQPARARAQGGSVQAYSRYEGPSGTVFVDARNSEGPVPPVGALVSVDGGREAVVRRVTPLYGLGGLLHHTEIEVG